jgi:hemerythrin-like domain-containing protein
MSMPAFSVEQEEVGPTEDLMREHGVLRRILLVYEESIRRIESGQPVPAADINESANIIRRFIQDYHEKLEEDYVFQVFLQTGRQQDLVNTLKTQHERGRAVTAKIIQLCSSKDANDKVMQKELIHNIRAFIAMYRPHAAREDTVVFPQFHKILVGKEFDNLGDKFEDKEKQLFGENGFEKMVAAVAAIETRLGINSLDKFTPAR